MREDSRRVWRRATRSWGAAALIALAILFVIFEGRILVLLLAGVLFALALHGSAGWLSAKARVPYGATLAAIAALVVASLACGLCFLGAAIAAQAESLVKQVPEAYRSLLDAIKHRPAIAQVVGPVADKAPSLKPDVAGLMSGANGAFEAVGALVVVFFLGVYGAAQPSSYSRVILALVPAAQRDRARSLLGEIGSSLTRWLGGRAVAMAVVGVMVTAGLYAMKIPLAGTLGVIAGLLTFVEYLGAFLSAAPAMLLAFSRGPMFVLWVALLFTVVHLVEGYVLTPFLVRRTVHFPPAYTLAAQVVLGALLGVAGLTFATPILIVATLVVRRVYVERHP